MIDTTNADAGASTIKVAFAGSASDHAPWQAERALDQACAQLDQLLQLKSSVGDGLNDHEFTRLALATLPAALTGFSFLCFSDLFVTLAVPPQNLEKWCAPPRWIAEGKEELARKIAEDFHLMVCEPPDQLSYIIAPRDAHHHLEFVTLSETVAVAHPLYIKLRLFSQTTKCFNRSREVLPPIVPLFREIAQLYA